MLGPEINKSYFFAVDTKHGWGNTSYFTYFSEFNRASKHDAYIEAGFLIALFAVSTIANVFIIGFILYNRDLRTTTNFLVCNLALADILFVTSGPFIAHLRLMDTWTLGESMCHYMNYAMFVCGTVMIWTMAVISIDRYICINTKRTSPRKVQPKYVFGMCALIWIITFPLYCPIALYFDVINVATDTGPVSFCSLTWPRGSVSYSAVFTLCVCIVGYIIPFVIIIVNYTRIYKILRTSRRVIAHASQGRTFPMRTSSIKLRNVRVVNTLVLLVVVFFLMITPLFITFIFIQQDSNNDRFSVPSHALVWTVIVCYVKACINPFLYAYLNNKLKRGMSSLCACKQIGSIGLNRNSTKPTLSTVSEERM